jgi:hypothetical protein
MAVVKTIKPSGGDYTSLSNWEAGRQADLTATDSEWAECYAMEDATAVTISGWTTTSTNRIRIYCASGHGHEGSWSDSKYRLVVSVAGGGVISQTENYVTLDGLQIYNTASDRPCGIIFNAGTFTNANNLTEVSRCILRGTPNTSTFDATLSHGGIRTNNLSSDRLILHVSNSVFYGWKNGAGGSGLMCGIEMRAYLGTGKFYNCTIHDCEVGIRQNSSTVTIKNTIFSGCISIDASGTVADTYCATTSNNTKGLNPSGTGNRFSQTFSFTDAANGDFRLLSSDTGAKDHGADLSGDAPAVTVDIKGESRTGTYDIGADEYIASVTDIFGELLLLGVGSMGLLEKKLRARKNALSGGRA